MKVVRAGDTLSFTRKSLYAQIGMMPEEEVEAALKSGCFEARSGMTKVGKIIEDKEKFEELQCELWVKAGAVGKCIRAELDDADPEYVIDFNGCEIGFDWFDGIYGLKIKTEKRAKRKMPKVGDSIKVVKPIFHSFANSPYARNLEKGEADRLINSGCFEIIIKQRVVGPGITTSEYYEHVYVKAGAIGKCVKIIPGEAPHALMFSEYIFNFGGIEIGLDWLGKEGWENI